MRLRLDDALGRIARAISRRLDEIRERLTMTEQRMRLRSPQFMVQGLDMAVEHQHTLLCSAMQSFVESRKGKLHTATAKVTALNPLAILKRGYSMARALPEAVLVKDVDQVRVGQHLEVTVSKGAMLCVVERKKGHGQTNI
jgi:exodeoxyribonuclease VII large subunit